MRQDLDSLKLEIEAALGEGGFAVFRGLDRASEPMPMVRWDVDQYPDPRAFLDTASRTGVRIIVFQHRQFSSAHVSGALEDLEAAEMPRDESRDVERRLRKFDDYDGFTCMIDLSFLSDGVWYAYQVVTPWYDEFLELIGEIEDAIDAAEESEDSERGPMGGYFSHN
jgi:hypothetical protein